MCNDFVPILIEREITTEKKIDEFIVYMNNVNNNK